MLRITPKRFGKSKGDTMRTIPKNYCSTKKTTEREENSFYQIKDTEKKEALKTLMLFSIFLLLMIAFSGCGKSPNRGVYYNAPTHPEGSFHQDVIYQNHSDHSHGYQQVYQLENCCNNLYHDYNSWYYSYRFNYNDPWCNYFWSYSYWGY